jgi:hypothetical protein
MERGYTQHDDACSSSRLHILALINGRYVIVIEKRWLYYVLVPPLLVMLS